MNESEEIAREAEKSEEEFINALTLNKRIKKMDFISSNDNVLKQFPELQVQLRQLQQNALMARQVKKLVSLKTIQT